MIAYRRSLIEDNSINKNRKEIFDKIVNRNCMQKRKELIFDEMFNNE